MDRTQYISLVEDSYFGNVSKKNIDAVLGCFTADCAVRIYHGDAPPRRFTLSDAGTGAAELRSFYQHLCGNYDPTFTEFVHYIDSEIGHCACMFLVTLTPTKDSLYRDTGVQQLRNSNFFIYEGGLIKDMTIYYANPQEDSTEPSGRPTGYPPNA